MRRLAREALWFGLSIAIGAAGVDLFMRPTWTAQSYLVPTSGEPSLREIVMSHIPIEVLRGFLVYAALGIVRIIVVAVRRPVRQP